MARILITGGAGFIGTHLAQAYLDRGDEVLVLDDLSTGSLENISYLQSDAQRKARLTFAIDSVLNVTRLEEFIAKADMVIHLAAAVGVKYILDNPLRSLNVNLGGTENVLALCEKYNRKVLLASTSEVYGKQSHAPLRETDNCVYGPSSKFRWNYAGSKLMDEFYGLAYHRTVGLQVVIVRLFNTVGPRQTGTYGMVIPRLVCQALEGRHLTVFGDGKQTRTFTHVREVASSMMKLMESPTAVGEVVNIGGVEEVSIYQLAEMIIELTGSSSKIELIPYEEAYPSDFDDMLRRVPCTDKLRSLIGSAPQIGLQAILKDVIEYHRERLASRPSDIPRVANL